MLTRSQNIDSIAPLTRSDFVPRGQTALLDAIGHTLHWVMHNKLMNPDLYTSCVIYIVTDGLENCSKVYSSEKIKNMITEAQTNYGVHIIYLGANQDSILQAEKYGISGEQAMDYTETRHHTEAAYRSAANVSRRVRNEGVAMFTKEERRCSSQK